MTNNNKNALQGEILTDSSELINKLNISLQLKNRRLSSLNAELHTFNVIIGNHFNETLKKLYTSIEFILTTDARNLSDSGKANLRRSQAAIQKMKLVTEDIISYASIERDEKPEDVCLDDVISEVSLELKNADFQGDLILDYDCAPPLKGYQNLLHLLVYNICENAFKFSETSAPAIHIDCRSIPGNKILHPAAIADIEYDEIRFKDNGKGFQMIESENIFQMFYQIPSISKFKGSGLGLTICKKIMELHQGFITAESVVNDGTIIKCYFPKISDITLGN